MERLGDGGRLSQLNQLLRAEKICLLFLEKNFCAGRIFYPFERNRSEKNRITYELFSSTLNRR